MFESIGQLLYTESGWIRMNPHPSIGLYYKAWIERTLHRKVNDPLHGYHVTVLNGRYANCLQHKTWKKYHNQMIPFTYSPEIQNDGRSFWLPIESPTLEGIRLELDLSPLPFWPFHITVANLKGLL